ncbi:hypothetical protein [Mycobacterium phage Maco2]|uniref:Uncharacterized protein n=1 Tax=Mycobacterium phage Maco2 TaxID=2805749 RepID=A0A899INF9_9CAUD|nr:hypothetical protein [Mycobacterium phage Maco2]
MTRQRRTTSGTQFPTGKNRWKEMSTGGDRPSKRLPRKSSLVTTGYE